jgi:hypothetical protein
LAHALQRAAVVGLGALEIQLCVRWIDDRQHFAGANRLGVRDHHLQHLARHLRADLRRGRVDVGVVGAHIMRADQHVVGGKAQRDLGDQAGHAVEQELALLAHLRALFLFSFFFRSDGVFHRRRVNRLKSQIVSHCSISRVKM